MSTEDRNEKDLLQSLIAEILEAEESGNTVDRGTLLKQHPEHAESLREFLANHDRMKAAANLDEPTLPPTGGGLDEPTMPPNQGSQADATTPPTRPASPNGASVGDQVRYFGDYELLEEIARGGMGVVFKARQINLNRTVALKMILAGQFAGQEDVQRFYIEAEAAANLDHPGIVPIFEIGEHQGQHYFSMGYVEGESLSHKVGDGPLPPHEAAELVRKICDAMAYAHERGVIHRDLKPANILIERNGQPKVTDFGLAKKTEADSNLTGTGQILGTPAYMPPEQASGKTDVGPLADVYSLGAILYCLLTGRPPFQASNPMDTLLQVLNRDPVPLRILTPQIPRDLETICLKCLRKESSKRYESAFELAAELQRYLDGKPIHARPVGNLERGWRWCKRNTALAVTGTIATLLLLTISFAGPIAAYTQAKLRQDADKKSAEAVDALYDLTTSFGLSADSQGDASQALLWFSEANKLPVVDSRKQVEGQLRLESWHRQLSSPVRVFSNDRERVDFLEFDATARFLASRSEHETCRVWQLDTERPPHIIREITGIAWHPSEPKLAMTFTDGRAQVMEWPSKTVIHSTEFDEAVFRVAFSPDGSLVALGGDRVRLWNVESGEVRESKTLGGNTEYLEFAIDMDWLLCLQDDSQVRILRSKDLGPIQSPILHRFATHDSGPAVYPHFAMGGRELLTRAGNRLIWSHASSGNLIRTILVNGPSINGIAVSPDQKQFAVATQDAELELWDCPTKRRVTLRKTDQPAWSPNFSPDGLELAVSTWRSHVMRFRSEDGLAIDEGLPTNQGDFLVRYAPSGRHLLVCDRRGEMTLWLFHSYPAISDGNKESTVQRQFRQIRLPQNGSELEISGTKSHLFACGDNWWSGRFTDAQLIPRDTDLSESKTFHSNSLVTDASISPDETLIVTAHVNHLIQFWDVRSQQLKWEPLELETEPLEIEFDHQGKYVFCLELGGLVTVIDAKTGEPIHKLDPGTVTVPEHWRQTDLHIYRQNNGMPIDLFFSYHLKPSKHGLLAVGGFDHRIRIWDVEKGKLEYEPLELTVPASILAISENNKYLVTNDDLDLLLVDLFTGQELARHPMATVPDVVAFSPDSSRLVVNCGDVLDVASNKVLRSIGGGAVEFLDEHGHWVMSAHSGGARVWSTLTGHPVTPLSPVNKIRCKLIVSREDSQAYVSGDGELVDVVPYAPRVTHPSTSTADWEMIAEVMAGREIVGGSAVDLSRDNWEKRFLKLKDRLPEKFPNDWPVDDLLAWHDVQRIRAIENQQWNSARWHGNHLEKVYGHEDKRALHARLELWLSQTAREIRSRDQQEVMLEWRTLEASGDLRRAGRRQLKLAYFLAWSLRSAGKTDAAMAVAETTLKLQRDHLGSTDKDVIATVDFLAETNIALPRLADARNWFRQEIGLYQSRIDATDFDLEAVNNLARLLVTCPDRTLHDYPRAIELASLATERAPISDLYLNTLGTAHYRAGNYKQAIETFQKSIGGGRFAMFAEDSFFVAMSFARLGDHETALNHFNRAIDWLKSNATSSSDIRLIQAEATQLLSQLGILSP